MSSDRLDRSDDAPWRPPRADEYHTAKFDGVGLEAKYTVTWCPLLDNGDEGMSATEDGEPCTIKRVLWGMEIGRDTLDKYLCEYAWRGPENFAKLRALKGA